MPPYCDNCGAVETPAWRRGYVKVFDGVYWDEVETSLSHGGVVYKHAIEHNADGSVKTFRGYKTDEITEDEALGWRHFSMCNREDFLIAS